MHHIDDDEADRIRAAFHRLELALRRAGILDRDRDGPGDGEIELPDSGPVRWLRGECRGCGRSYPLSSTGAVRRHGGRNACAGAGEMPTLIYTVGKWGEYHCPRCGGDGCRGPHIPERRFLNESAAVRYDAGRNARRAKRRAGDC